jgi:hypothetical protein
VSVKRLQPHRSETQDWEHSAARNQPAASRQKALDRQAAIRRGDGNKANASHQDSGPWPEREEPKIW